MTLTWAQALTWRMRRQLLDPIVEVPVEDVVRRLGAVAAWPLTTPELAIGMRRAGAHPEDLTQALDDRLVIKTYASRGATQVMTPQDAGAYLALRASGRQWERRSWQDTYGLTPDDWPEFRAVVRDAVDEHALTREELRAAVARHPRYEKAADGLLNNSDTLLKPLMWQGDVCFAPPGDGAGKVQGLGAIPGWGGIPDVDDAGRRLVEAYIATYGPTTRQHVHYHLTEGLSAGRRAVDRWLDDLADRCTTVDLEEEQTMILTRDLDELRSTEATQVIRLLGGVDPWVMGPGTADTHVVPAAHRAPVSRGANLVLEGGVVIGTWAVRAGTLTATMFDGREAGGMPGLREEAERIAVLRGSALELGV